MLTKLKKKLDEQTKDRGNLSLKDLPHPHLLKNNKEISKRIIENLNNGKNILIAGDYDCDGMFATIILYDFLKEIGYSNIFYKIPSRLIDGYGLNRTIVDEAIEKNCFIVTVDNGIGAHDAVDYANEKGVEVIITDHHTAPAVLPKTKLIMNPKVPGETFPFLEISGATVAWYLIAALKIELGLQTDIKKYLDLVAITVISDVMPLANINLPLLKYGIELIKKKNRPFYSLLWNDWSMPTVDETAVAFGLVPMINAIGRIDDANKIINAFSLHLNQKYLFSTFSFMKSVNDERKKLSNEYTLSAEQQYLNSIHKDENVIIIKNEDFHEGIVGIVAGKLAEKYNKPTFVFSYNHKKELWKGSGRSSGDVHLYEFLKEASTFVFGYGGHKEAVGLAVAKDSWESFTEDIYTRSKKLNKESLVNKGSSFIECDVKDLTLDLYNFIKQYKPFGSSNPAPQFTTTTKMKILQEFKGGNHFKCSVFNDNSASATVLFFNVDKEEILNWEQKEEERAIMLELGLSYNLQQNSFSLNLIGKLGQH